MCTGSREHPYLIKRSVESEVFSFDPMHVPQLIVKLNIELEKQDKYQIRNQKSVELQIRRNSETEERVPSYLNPVSVTYIHH